MLNYLDTKYNFAGLVGHNLMAIAVIGILLYLDLPLWVVFTAVVVLILGNHIILTDWEFVSAMMFLDIIISVGMLWLIAHYSNGLGTIALENAVSWGALAFSPAWLCIGLQLFLLFGDD